MEPKMHVSQYFLLLYFVIIHKINQWPLLFCPTLAWSPCIPNFRPAYEDLFLNNTLYKMVEMPCSTQPYQDIHSRVKGEIIVYLKIMVNPLNFVFN